MKVILQRVARGKVTVNEQVVGKIERGIVALVGFEKGDLNSFIEKMTERVVFLRIFEDSEGKMNLSLKDINGGLLLVPNFTLAADCKKGRRPGFQFSESPEKAEEMFLKFVNECKKYVEKVETGIFGADMKVDIVNDGPVTLVLDSDKLCRGG